MTTKLAAPFKSNRGGHNKLMGEKKPEPQESVLVDELPWIKRPGGKVWTRRKIFNYLARRFYEQGFTTSVFAGELVTRLSHCHYQMSLAFAAIEADPFTPKVGKRDAHSVASSAGSQMLDCMSKLGLYPLPKRDANYTAEWRRGQDGKKAQVVMGLSQARHKTRF